MYYHSFLLSHIIRIKICLQGWVDCFEKAELAGALFCGGISDPGEASGKKDEQIEAYEFGKSLE